MPCILTRCGAFLLPGCNTAQHKRLQRILRRQCNYTAHTTKQRTGLYSGISCDCTHSIAYYTSTTKAAIMPPAPRWSAYQRPKHLQHNQIPPPRRDAAQVSAAVYYNKVYKRVQRCAPVIDPCQTVQHIADHASPAGQSLPLSIWQGSARRGLDASHARWLEVWHPTPGGAVQQQEARRAARNHWRLPPQLFSGFCPIANRGQQ